MGLGLEGEETGVCTPGKKETVGHVRSSTLGLTAVVEIWGGEHSIYGRDKVFWLGKKSLCR